MIKIKKDLGMFFDTLKRHYARVYLRHWGCLECDKGGYSFFSLSKSIIHHLRTGHHIHCSKQVLYEFLKRGD